MRREVESVAERLVRHTIEEYNMPPKDKPIVVGFSGGSDSVCLLDILYRLGYKVIAAHLNHNMRPTAMRDMEFCERFCKERGIAFESHIVPEDSLKSEADAREARYSFFRDVMERRGIEYLATAHNKNDSAETVLLHLLRGASTDGLCGIEPIQGNILRPLIAVKKREVLDYCRENKLEFMTDETNLTDIYSRNKLRNRFIPDLEREFNPSLIDVLADNAHLMAEDREYLRKSAEVAFSQIIKDDGIRCDELPALEPAIKSRVIQLLWQKSTGEGNNLSRVYIDSISELSQKNKNGTKLSLPYGFSARIDYGILTISKEKETLDFEYEIDLGRWYEIPEAKIKTGIFEDGEGLLITLDGDERLTVRNRRSGDRFVPSGMKGSKSLSDYFTDIKMPREKRDLTPVFLADGEIAAVGNLRAADCFSKGKRGREYVIRITSGE